MRIIQIAGYKNSGKTTLVGDLIRYFSKKGLKTAALKHHGHGGTPAVTERTDSAKFAEAGALMSGVEGAGVLQLTVSRTEWTIDQLLQFYRLMHFDLLMIEGYKTLDFNKIVLIRSLHDVHLLEQLSNIIAIVTSVQLDAKNMSYPVFRESEPLCAWLSDHVLML